MASVNFKKIKTAYDAKSKLRHCDKEWRLKSEHKNVHIDKTLTPLNVSIKGLNYSQACEFYDDEIFILDTMPGRKNKRSDRVTLMGLSIPFYDNVMINRDEGLRWFNRVYDLIGEQYGKHTLVEGYIHFDEIHDYVDPDTGETFISRPHMHVYVIPEVDNKLCAKKCMARDEMIKLNNAIDKMTQQEFGAKFMTGEKSKSRGTVEQMKEKSAVVQQALAEVEQEKEQHRQEYNDFISSVNALKSDYEQKRDNLDAIIEKRVLEGTQGVREACQRKGNRVDVIFNQLEGLLSKVRQDETFDVDDTVGNTLVYTKKPIVSSGRREKGTYRGKGTMYRDYDKDGAFITINDLIADVQRQKQQERQNSLRWQREFQQLQQEWEQEKSDDEYDY